MIQITTSVAKYALAIGAVSLGVALRWALHPLLGEQLPFATLYPAIAAAVWFGGWRPALFATVLGYVAVDWLFISPLYTLAVVGPRQWIDLITFCAGGFLIVLFGEFSQRAREGAEKRSQELARAMRALQETQNQLAALNKELEKRVRERTAKLTETLTELEGFSYTIAHDMRAPLRSMAGFAQLIEQEWGSKLDTDATDYLRRISRSARRLDCLILDVLDYARVVRGDWPIQAVAVDSLVRDIISSYPQFHANVTVQGTLPPVQGNVAALTQCFSQLLDNAVKFVKPGANPETVIRAESCGERVRVWVEDQGIGIPAEWHERIFGLFQHYHPESEYEGTGLGLTIVRKSVDRMGGRVGVESQPGKGSRFWIELAAAID